MASVAWLPRHAHIDASQGCSLAGGRRMQARGVHCCPASVLSGNATWCGQRAAGTACHIMRCLAAGVQAPIITQRTLAEEVLRQIVQQ